MSEEVKKRTLVQNVKTAVLIALAVLAAVVMWNNRQQVDIDLAFFPITMPLFIALLGSLAVGFLLGTFWGRRLLFGRRRR